MILKLTTRDGFSVTTNDMDLLEAELVMAGGACAASRPRDWVEKLLIRVKDHETGLHVILLVSEIVRAEEVLPPWRKPQDTASRLA